MGGVEIERRFGIRRRNLVWSSSVFLGAEGGVIYEEVRLARRMTFRGGHGV